MLPFVVMDVNSLYNAFLSRPALAEFKAAITFWCLTLEFSTKNGVGIIHGDQATGHARNVAELRDAQRRKKGKDVEKPLCIKTNKP